jgi:hypothetical protein
MRCNWLPYIVFENAHGENHGILVAYLLSLTLVTSSLSSRGLLVAPGPLSAYTHC